MRRIAGFVLVLLGAGLPAATLAAPGGQWAPVDVRHRLVEGEQLVDPRTPLTNYRTRTEASHAVRSAVDGCPHDFDVLHYELNFNSLTAENVNLDGNTVIDLESAVDGLASIDLNFTSQMTVSSVTVTPNGLASFSHVADVLTVNLTTAADTGDTVSVDVAYSGLPWNEGSGGFGGFWWSLTPKVAYSMGVGLNTEPPSMGFSWFPCYDWPCDKATVALNIETPLSQVAVANGLLTGVDSTATDHTWHWAHDYPISTYLIAMAVAPYKTLSDTIVTDPRISVYHMPGFKKKSSVSFQYTDLMMQAFETRYGPYPFDKFAFMMTVLGDMEHQTCVSHAVSLVDSTNNFDPILAHEMGHQWFGDCVTYADWRNIWLSEGFATYSEAVFEEFQSGTAAYHTYVTNFIMNPVINSGQTDGVYDPANKWGAINYEKGGSVLHMLRGVLDNDTLFWQVLTDYHTTYAYGNAETSEFIASASATAGQDLSWFFNPWVFGEGHPHYEYGWSWEQNGANYDVDVVIRQVQTTASLFDMPVDFRVQTGAGDFDFSMQVDQAEHEFTFTVPALPTGFLVDPDDWILDEQFLAPTSVDWNAAAAEAQSLSLQPARPNPVRDLTQLRYFLPRAGRVDVSIHDVSGRKVRALYSGHQSAGSRAVWWDRRNDGGRAVGSGVYWVRLETEDGRRSQQIVVRN
ncbi:MAG: T9SS type A sorting domain-containing protein [Gemmatimonadetes bacterium]|nr:T9SS type A sorting domain-containing protein [Gemmatimonadota bacterium]